MNPSVQQFFRKIAILYAYSTWMPQPLMHMLIWQVALLAGGPDAHVYIKLFRSTNARKRLVKSVTRQLDMHPPNPRGVFYIEFQNSITNYSGYIIDSSRRNNRQIANYITNYISQQGLNITSFIRFIESPLFCFLCWRLYQQ